MKGFSDEQIIEIRKGSASFNPKLDALAEFAKSVVGNAGKIDDEIEPAYRTGRQEFHSLSRRVGMATKKQ